MRFMSWMRNLNSSSSRTKTGARRRPSIRPRLEVLEDRCTPSTFTVSNFKDAGAGSLRQAVINANNRAGPDTVVFKPGLEGTIKLTSGQINITGALFLDGPGANKITIDGNQNGRIFQVFAPSSVKVTLDGLTLFNAKTIAEGSAIQSTANLHVIGMVITGNTAALGGGAIETFHSNLTIQKSRIIGNTANNGGGIFASGKTLIEDSTISGNQANLGVGGGIYAVDVGATLTLRRSTVAGNLATTDGGGIYVWSTVTSLIIQNSTIEGNHAGRWGGGVVTAAASNSITDTRIRYNRSEDVGGGLASNTPTVIKRSTISGNSSRIGWAGGISQYQGALTLVDSTVSGNSALNGNAGGIYIAATTAASTILRSTIAGNWAGNGGGLYVLDSARLTIQNSTISGNSASANGGGLFADSDGVRLQNATVAFNRADTGGGILANRPIFLESTIVANNSATSSFPDLAAGAIEPAFYLTSSLISTTPGPNAVEDLGNSQFNVDPRLAPLANNGGLTQTHALKKGSPAINRGFNPAGLTTDQRGGPFKRLLGKAVDIGAFERE